MSETAELKVDERLKANEEVLNQYSTSMGLDAIKYNSDAELVLKLGSNDLKGLTSEEALCYGYVLSNYGAFLSKEIGRQNAILSWANYNLGVVIGKVYSNYGNDYVKYDVRKVLICADNEYAAQLSKIALQATLRIEHLKGVDFQVSKMADFLKEIAKTKRYSSYE